MEIHTKKNKKIQLEFKFLINSNFLVFLRVLFAFKVLVNLRVIVLFTLRFLIKLGYYLSVYIE